MLEAFLQGTDVDNFGSNKFAYLVISTTNNVEIIFPHKRTSGKVDFQMKLKTTAKEVVQKKFSTLSYRFFIDIDTWHSDMLTIVIKNC